MFLLQRLRNKSSIHTLEALDLEVFKQRIVYSQRVYGSFDTLANAKKKKNLIRRSYSDQLCYNSEILRICKRKNT